MKKKNLQSLKLNKNTISKASISAVKGGAISYITGCISNCLGFECEVAK